MTDLPANTYAPKGALQAAIDDSRASYIDGNMTIEQLAAAHRAIARDDLRDRVRAAYDDLGLTREYTPEEIAAAVRAAGQSISTAFRGFVRAFHRAWTSTRPASTRPGLQFPPLPPIVGNTHHTESRE